MKHCAKHNNNIKSHTHRNSTHVVINAAFLISLNEQPSNQPTNVLLINTIPFYCDLRHLSQLPHSPANASHLTLHVAPATKIAYPNKVKVWCGILHSVPRRRRSGVFVVIGGCGTAEDEVGEEMILHQYLVLFPGQPAIQRDISYEQATLTRNTCIAYPSSRPGIKSHGVHSTIAIVVTTQASSRAGTTKAPTTKSVLMRDTCTNSAVACCLCLSGLLRHPSDQLIYSSSSTLPSDSRSRKEHWRSPPPTESTDKACCCSTNRPANPEALHNNIEGATYQSLGSSQPSYKLNLIGSIHKIL